jgi:uncharacterized protein (DUF362 family)
MKIHPLLNDPSAVLVYRTPVPDSPTHQDFQRAAKEVMEILQIELDGEKVAIKPNATSAERFGDPDLGVGTHPAFVGGMVEYLYTHGARRKGIYVVEDPRNSDDFNPRHWKETGYLEMAEASGAKLRSPVSYYCVRKKVPHPMVHPVRNVTRYAVDTNTVLINVPKLKTHNLAITTLCMKNLMGLDDVFDRHYCAQSWQKLPVHPDDQPKTEWMDAALHEVWQHGLACRLADLAQVIPPSLNLVEGLVGRDGTGFHHGRNYPLGLVIAGTNMVAVDSLASYLIGFDPLELIYLKVAASAGLGCNDLTQLRVYLASGGELVLCQDLEPLRARPSFRIIRDILGESEYQFS